MVTWSPASSRTRLATCATCAPRPSERSTRAARAPVAVRHVARTPCGGRRAPRRRCAHLRPAGRSRPARRRRGVSGHAAPRRARGCAPRRPASSVPPSSAGRSRRRSRTPRWRSSTVASATWARVAPRKRPVLERRRPHRARAPRGARRAHRDGDAAAPEPARDRARAERAGLPGGGARRRREHRARLEADGRAESSPTSSSRGSTRWPASTGTCTRTAALCAACVGGAGPDAGGRVAGQTGSGSPSCARHQGVSTEPRLR